MRPSAKGVKCRPYVPNDCHQYCPDPLSAKVPNRVLDDPILRFH